ncbi:hypothetical protein O0I10_000220 [Lichtheimia ornata]|uniref:Uncharacterized protein n=1 Tax=Lichtheimia ornata TaxID=688661 RepID=A0AAD8DJ66_9FUNG|nr:uncharacterized protein O0I10_000220 [Lichtheimia ornata]KAJ8663945.1 hypothetical protein O0I10_000220 [Lichtheimia ornata]
MSETATSQLNEHVQKVSSIHKKQPPKLEFLYHYNDAIKGYAAELTLFGRTYRSHFYKKKKTAKEAVSAMALYDQPYMAKAKVPPLQEEPLDEKDTSAWQSFAKANAVLPPPPPTAPTNALSPVNSNNNNTNNMSSNPSAAPRRQMVQRVQRWLDHSLNDQHSKSYVSLLNELVQVLAIEPPRYTTAQAYHAIGGRTHAPYTATLFVDSRVFTTPEPQDTINDAKNHCAYYAIVALVYDVCGVSVDQQQPLQSLQQPLSPYQQFQPLQSPQQPSLFPPQQPSLFPSQQPHQQLQPQPSALPPGVLTRPLPKLSLPPGIHKRPIISTFNKTEMMMLNELASKLQWEIPTYDIEDSIDERTKSTIFRCTITLQAKKDKQASNGEQQQQQQEPYVFLGTQWCQSKNQAKHCTAAQALEELSQNGLCVIVRD